MCNTLEVHNKWTQRVAEFKKTHGDWEEVVGKSQAPVYCLAEMHIALLPNGPAIAYYLAKNPIVAQKIFDAGLHFSIDAIAALSIQLEKP